MNKLEQAARQALDALELAIGSHGVMLMSNPPHDAWQYRRCDFKLAEAITVLREALEQPDEIDWIETNKALAKEIIELKKQAEQESVGYFAYDEEHDIWEELTGPNAPGATPLYAAPVRTKHLTASEIRDIWNSSDTYDVFCVEFARAVIAADREKNK